MTALPRLFVRADAGPGVGLGHVMRCLALAQAWRACAAPAEFMVTPTAAQNLLEQEGFAVHSIPQPHPSPVDLETTLGRLGASEKGGRPWLLLDGYGFDPRYQEAVASRAHLMMLDDDLRHPSYRADILVNQNLGAEALTYPCNASTLQLLGARFALIREEFRAQPRLERTHPDRVRRLLLTCGGADPTDFSARAVAALAAADLEDVHLTVLIGPDHLSAAALEAKASKLGNVKIVQSPKSMVQWMDWADAAITCAGSTCWEMAFRGLPMITVAVSPNQQMLASELAARGAALDLGWHDSISPDKLRRLMSALCGDRSLRQAMSREARRLIDGDGVQRILSIVGALKAERLEPGAVSLRAARLADALPLWRLANEPEVRGYSFSSGTIALESHLTWLGAKLASGNSRVWVVDLADLVVAQVRYDRIGADVAEVHFAVAKPFRGKGLGTRMLELTTARALSELAVARVQGVVLQENHASARAFLRAGFREIRSERRQGRECLVFETERS